MNDYQLRTQAQLMAMCGMNLAQTEGKDPYKEWDINGKLKEYVNDVLGILHKFISGKISFTEWEDENQAFLMAADTRIETPVLKYNFKSVKVPISVFCEIEYSKERLNKQVTRRQNELYKYV